jgi:serine/threonine-protein kinase HipA
VSALDVVVGSVVAAHLTFSAEGRFSLEYTSQWLANPEAYPFSPRLPLKPVDVSIDAHSAQVRNFFSNLLPEGRALEDALGMHHVPKGSVFALLQKLGGEMSGALRLLPTGLLPPDSPVLREIPSAELRARILKRPKVPFTVWDERTRLSVAGFQDKLAVYIDGDSRFYLADGSAASTHLLKPEATDSKLTHLPANEHFCLRLATACGLPVAESRLIRLPEPLLVIKRFDRRGLQDGSVVRSHQIDACQALGLAPDYKYEEPFGEGTAIGADLTKVFGLTAECAAPAVARGQMLRWLLFQVLIGNTDAHAKNLSFFVGRDGLTPAPAYDLVCGLIYGFSKLAMKVGDTFVIDDLRAFQWASFAYDCRIPKQHLAREMSKMAGVAQKALPGLIGDPSFNSVEKRLLRKVAALVTEQAMKFELLAKEVPGIADRHLE